MGKSKISQPENDAEEVKEPIPAPAEDEEAAPNNTLVNHETAAYLKEISTLIRSNNEIDSDLLISNVLDEIDSKQVQVASDPICSRYVEPLLAAAKVNHLLQFFKPCLDKDNFVLLVTNPFGSHVTEKLLVRVGQLLRSEESDAVEQLEQMLNSTVEVVSPLFYEMSCDRFATHVVRSLICTLCGRDVQPKRKSKPGAAGQQSMASRLSAKAADAVFEAPLLPDLLSRLLRVILGEDYTREAMAYLAYDMYASPVLQTALKAAEGNSELLAALIPAILGSRAKSASTSAAAAAAFAECDVDAVVEMMQDQTASHLVEMALSVSPQDVLAAFHTRFVAGRVAELALHATANFPIQTLLGCTSSKKMAQSLAAELSPIVAELLRRRRAGVVAALLGCIVRSGDGAAAKSTVAAVEKAAESLSQGSSKNGVSHLASALFTLDTMVDLEQLAAGASVPGARLSAPGCAILTSIMKLSQSSSRTFTDGVSGLSHEAAIAVARDPSGSRVLEALLEGNAPPKVKQQLLKTLCGGYGQVALTAPGSYVIEKAYDTADLELKEAIVGDVVGVQTALQGTHWGPSLMRRLGCEAYQRDMDAWRRHAGSAAKVQSMFKDILGVDGGKQNGKAAKAASEPAIDAKKRAKPADDTELAEAGPTKKKEKKMSDKHMASIQDNVPTSSAIKLTEGTSAIFTALTAGGMKLDSKKRSKKSLEDASIEQDEVALQNITVGKNERAREGVAKADDVQDDAKLTGEKRSKKHLKDVSATEVLVLQGGKKSRKEEVACADETNKTPASKCSKKSRRETEIDANEVQNVFETQPVTVIEKKKKVKSSLSKGKDSVHQVAAPDEQQVHIKTKKKKKDRMLA